MIRFLWLLATITGWGYVLVYLPRMPTIALLVLPAISIVGYMYGWAMLKRNHLMYFFCAALWLSVWAGYGVMRWWEQAVISGENELRFQIPIPVYVVGKTVLLVTFFISCILTFANYRISLSFMRRRGNFEKDRLVRLYPGEGVFESLKKWITARNKPKDIRITLGEEIPFNDT